MLKSIRQSSSPIDLLDFSDDLQHRYNSKSIPEDRKKRGQYFTPHGVARFMAGLFCTFTEHIKVLDPGAGTGTLSAAVCDRILRLRSPRSIEVVLYENDPAVTPLLEENMKHCRSALRKAGHSMTYEIRQEDFILSSPHVFEQLSLFESPKHFDMYDFVIMNPPYFKIQKCSEHALMMQRIVHGQPNIYALFMALSAELLRPRGELVAITPRSFCGGPYFRGFRRWFFERMSLGHIHLFESRKEAFRGANVLQESVITCTARLPKKPAAVTITTSVGGDLAQESPARQMRVSDVIDDSCKNMVIRIPETAEDARVMQLVESWPKRFTDHGLRVSTGPVVMFRATEFLLESPNGRSTAPLLAVHNIHPFATVWPLRKNGKPTALKVCAKSRARRLLLPTKNYVLLRRFSAKEQRRRLTASCFLRANASSAYIALENHLNYIYHAERELSEDETYGVAALFNSALLDRYFRTFSGNTQVNATELRTIPFPSLEKIIRIGNRIKSLRKITREKVEKITLDECDVKGRLESYLMEFAK